MNEEEKKYNQEKITQALANNDKEVELQTKYVHQLQQENQQLKEQLKQRDEVIDEAINHLDCFISDISLSKYDTLKILMYTKEVLQKYKGDNNE